MKNFPVKVDGKVYWISRSVATVGFVFKLVGNTIYTLIEKRGKGAADNVGSYCVPCGYIDYDETGEECIVREIFEETGFKCKQGKIQMVSVNTDPRKDDRQNISIHYIYKAEENELYNRLVANGGEVDEIDEVDWLPTASIDKFSVKILEDNFKDKKWAFNHDSLIKNYIKNCYENQEKKKKNNINDEVIKAFRKANREIEMERNGGRWIAVNRPHQNKKKYDRKRDCKIDSDSLFNFLYN